MFLLKLGSELQNLVKKFAVQYESIKKLQIAFPQSGIFPRSGMHSGWKWQRGIKDDCLSSIAVL